MQIPIRHILLAFSFVLFTLFSFAQNDDYVGKPKPKKEPIDWQEIKKNFYTGGNIGAQFGTVTFVNLSPILGYKITDELSIAAGPIYYYLNYNSGAYSQPFSAYGARIFSRYFVYNDFFVQAEYETLNAKWDYSKGRFFVPSFFAGLGYRQRISDNISLNFMVMWNFLQGPYSPYQNPVIRGGINIGL